MGPKFILEHIDPTLHKNLNLPTEYFEEWGYHSNPDIDDETYLAAFLATWEDFCQFHRRGPIGDVRYGRGDGRG